MTPSNSSTPDPVIATISEFFRRNRLSTILDQTNPLSEIDNLRRLSVMGTGGHSRARQLLDARYQRLPNTVVFVRFAHPKAPTSVL